MWQESEESKDLDVRLQTIISYCTKNIYTNIARGLFAKHKLVFSFMLCCQILRQRGDIAIDSWNYFLRGAGAGDKERPPVPSLPWLQEADWNSVFDLETAMPELFMGLSSDFVAAPLKLTINDFHVHVNAEKWDGPKDAIQTQGRK